VTFKLIVGEENI